MKTIGELALEMPNAINVLERLKIDYCCHGSRSIAEACQSAGVSEKDLLEEIGEGRVVDDERAWQNETLVALQRYIVDTHHVFTRQMLDTVRQLAEKVAVRHSAHHPEVVTVYALVEELYNDLYPHMMKEEQVLFPYMVTMEQAILRGDEPPVPVFSTIRNPIRMMMLEHDAAAIKLTELRTVTSDYELPDDACLSFRALYERLADLEQDLHRHIHLENNVLFPRAAAMEETARPIPAFGAASEHCCGH